MTVNKTKYNIPYGRQAIDQLDIDAVTASLKSDFLTQGPQLAAFETKFAAYVGAKYALAVSNATAGLHIAVLALELKKGERVITTPITFAASANCVRYAEGEVWFSDIDPDTYLISYEKTKELLESKPRGFFKGLIPVDFAGLPVNLEQFRKLADEHGLWIIEDACHAPGAYFTDSGNKKQHCGNGAFADCAVFSFHPVKHIACGEGGMVTTNREDLYRKLLLLRSHGITKDPELLTENHGGWYYEMQELGYNYRLTDFQAALGITQLAKNPAGLERRNEIAQRYKQAFEGKLKYQALAENSYNAHHLFVVETENRKEFYNFLHANGIYAQIHYIPVHKLPYYVKNNPADPMDTDLKNAENYYQKCISLPMYPALNNEELDYIIEKITGYFDT